MFVSTLLNFQDLLKTLGKYGFEHALLQAPLRTSSSMSSLASTGSDALLEHEEINLQKGLSILAFIFKIVWMYMRA